MATEKVNIIEIDIDVAGATKDTRDLKIQLQQLKDQAKKTKESQGELSDEYIEYQAALKVTQKEIRQNEKLTQNLITAQTAEKGSLDSIKAQLSVTSAQWSKLSEKERLNSETGKKLTAQKTKLTAQLKKEERATGDARRMTGFGRAMSLALGPIGLVIGAIALVVGALKSFFTSSEEGQDKLREFGAVFDVIVGNITDLMSGFGKKIVKIFENPKKAISDLAKALKENITNRIKGLLELLPALGKAISQVFARDFKKAGKTATDAVAKVALGVEDFTDKTVEGFEKGKKAIKDFVKETGKEIAITRKNANLQASLNRQLRNTQIANAKDLQTIAEIRNKAAQKENFTAQERLKLLDEAIKKENEVLKRNESIAEQKLRIKTISNSLSNSTKEDLDEQARLEVALINVRTQNFEKTRKLQSERLSASREIAKEQAKIEKESAAELEEAERKKINKQLEVDKGRIEKQKKYLDNEKQRKITNEQNELALQEETIFSKLELEREGLEAKRLKELAFAEEIGADKTLIERKYADAREEINKAENNAKISLAADFLGNIAAIAGEGTGIGKAAAVAQATVSTYQAATGAYASLASIPVVGPGLGIAAAAAAVVAGLANVKKILSVKSGLPGDSGGGGSSVGGGGASIPTGVAPSVNQGIVSRDNGIAADAEDIEVKPTLVIDQVTSSQNQEMANTNTSVI